MRKIKELTDKVKSTLKKAVKMMHCVNKRRFQAQVTTDYLDGSPRKAERVFGWGREAVKKGIQEMKLGIQCVDNYSARGRKRTESKIPALEKDIHDLAEPTSQADSHLRTPFAYTRITGTGIRQALTDRKGHSSLILPGDRTFRSILNRLDYRLKRVQNTKVVKRVPETDAIFANIKQVHLNLLNKPFILRISIDTKTKLNIGDYCRYGVTRLKKPDPGWDHDVHASTTLIPFGIFEPQTDQVTIIFGTSCETSDFIVDGLEHWWNHEEYRFSRVRELVINSDNGPHVNSHRSRFIERLVDFTDNRAIRTHLVYYPPYHSKYNPIERCWGVLERHWNGTLLNSVEKVLEWTKTMTWRGIRPIVHLLDKVYQKGVKLSQEMKEWYECALERSKTLPKWDVIIESIGALSG